MQVVCFPIAYIHIAKCLQSACKMHRACAGNACRMHTVCRVHAKCTKHAQGTHAECIHGRMRIYWHMKHTQRKRRSYGMAMECVSFAHALQQHCMPHSLCMFHVPIFVHSATCCMYYVRSLHNYMYSTCIPEAFRTFYMHFLCS